MTFLTLALICGALYYLIEAGREDLK